MRRLQHVREPIIREKKSRYRFWLMASLSAFIFAFSPGIIVLITVVIAKLLGCTQFDVCNFLGMNIGPLLGAGGLSAFFLGATIPLGFAIGILFLVLSGFAKVAEDKEASRND